MITTYLLQDCKYCKQLLSYIKKNPNVNILLIIVSKDDVEFVKNNEKRIKQFPVAFTGVPKLNGLPYKNSHMISGSNTILESLKNNYGNLRGSNISIDYLNDNEGNIGSLNNIRKHRNNCFGKSCHVMDRPFGPVDNQYILQGYQPQCAIPMRTGLPIKYETQNELQNNFGTTPGTLQWKSERKIWPKPSILINDRNCEQDLLGNKLANINVPMTYSDDKLNRKCKYGKFIKPPVTDNAPYLTWAAGGNGVSRITGKNYYPEQVPIEKGLSDSYIGGNLKQYVLNHENQQKLLSGGFNSDWSINAQGIKSNFGNIDSVYPPKLKRAIKSVPRIARPTPPNQPMITKSKSIDNKYDLVQTAFNSSQGTSGVAQYFKPNMFPKNGNLFGKKTYSKKSSKDKKERSKHKKERSKDKKEMKFTSPLGIEISFN